MHPTCKSFSAENSGTLKKLSHSRKSAYVMYFPSYFLIKIQRRLGLKSTSLKGRAPFEFWSKSRKKTTSHTSISYYGKVFLGGHLLPYNLSSDPSTYFWHEFIRPLKKFGARPAFRKPSCFKENHYIWCFEIHHMGGPKDGGCLNCKRKSIKITFRKPSCLSENDQRALSKTAALGSVLATLFLRNFMSIRYIG